ncbi:MAG TPA: hypothetical protein VHM02_03265, partial [Thermoanaerobaculia bacterium]|nr:hypothetical protein [Thermoanaerobaculia bacterium]
MSGRASSALSPQAADAVAAWCALWRLPGLEERVTIRFSRKLTASLGRATPARRSIRLAAALAAGP